MRGRLGRLRGGIVGGFGYLFLRCCGTAWSEEAEVLVVLLIGVVVSLMMLLESLDPGMETLD